MKHSAWVMEDDLHEWNLRTKDDPKMFNVSVHVDGEFTDNLFKLLKEYNDSFAWD